VREGLYKVDFHTVHGTGSGVIYAIGGKLRGGNGTDRITLALKGAICGDMVDFEGSALQLPGVAFRAVLALIED
jgi:hypothetical protein